MRVAILGPLTATCGDREVTPAGGRLRALLARLALDAGAVVALTSLADAVWDGASPADEAHALQSLVSRLRRGLGDAALVVQMPGGYRLAADHGAVDALEFERLARTGAASLRDGDPAGAASTLAQALALWRGPALSDVEGRFALEAAARLEDRRLEAIATWADAETALGRPAASLAELDAAAAGAPLDERIASRLIRALAAAGRQADALAAYERLRTALDAELGVTPAAEAQAAHLAVLRGEIGAHAQAAAAAEAAPRPAAPRTNLPAPLTRFVGRDAEQAQIASALATERLVTLTGPGGAGKTRLAVEVARAQLAPADDADGRPHALAGAWLAELAPVSPGEDLPATVLSALGGREALRDRRTPPPQEAAERLVDLLDGRTLLVVDNCEHLIDAAAVLADMLLSRCPELRILATSREPLGITGERLVPVPPLGLPEPGAAPADALRHPAVELFADRAAAASPGFAVDAATVGPVVEICRALDGLPLALELAAARLRTLSAQEIAARLDDRFRLLTAGSRAALPRHRTLRAVVDWSWELLAEPERRLARRLAVFRGGATAAAAVAVCGEPGEADVDVLDGVAALVDRSLLVRTDGPERDPAPRYRMLETIREYGLEQLDAAGDAAATRERHATWFAQLAHVGDPGLRTHEQPVWLARLDAERDNLFAALRTLADGGDARRALALAVDMLWFWTLNGAREEAVGWTTLAAAVPGDTDPLDRRIADVVTLFSGPVVDESVEMRARLGEALGDVDPADVARRPIAAVALAVMAGVSGDAERAARAIAVARENPDPWVRAAASLAAAFDADNRGQGPATLDALMEAADAFATVGDGWGRATALATAAGIKIGTGDLAGARAAISDAGELTTALGLRSGLAFVSVREAEIALRQGDFDAAREIALGVIDAVAVGGEAQFALVILARTERAAGNPQAAEHWIAEAVGQLGGRRPSGGHERATVLAMRAQFDAEAGELGRAREAADAALAATSTVDDLPVAASVAVGLAAIAMAEEDAARAAELLGAAERMRGSADATNPDVIRIAAPARRVLGEAGFDAAYALGMTGTPREALARLSVISGGAAPVGAQGERDEDDEEHAHPGEGPEHV